jgi:hypothetical protein
MSGSPSAVEYSLALFIRHWAANMTLAYKIGERWPGYGFRFLQRVTGHDYRFSDGRASPRNRAEPPARKGNRLTTISQGPISVRAQRVRWCDPLSSWSFLF